VLRRLLTVALLACAIAVALPPATAEAQRAPAGAPGHAVPRPGPGPYHGGYWHGYTPYYYPWFGWYAPWGPYGWYGYPPPPYYAFTNSTSAVRLQVTPRETEVYVEGSLAGTVDDFDGTFQRLLLPPGEHEIQLYLPGYKSVRQKVLLAPHSTYRIRHTMVPLAPGEPQEPPPVAAPPQPSEREAPEPAGLDEVFGRAAEGQPRRGDPSGVESSGLGSVSIRVQPPDADILIDGESWQGPNGQRLVVELGEGTHRVEVRKDGYRSFVTEVQVRPGDVTTLNVSLLREEL
jgi:hypothetical protein